MALQPMTYTLPNQSTKHKTCNYYNSCGCRFGDKCWFDHSVNKSSVNHDILHQLITLNGTLIKQQKSITKIESAIKNLRGKQSDEITANISDNILDKINAILHQQQSQNKINRFDNEQTNIKQQLNNLNKQMIKINQQLLINKQDKQLINISNTIQNIQNNNKIIKNEQQKQYKNLIDTINVNQQVIYNMVKKGCDGIDITENNLLTLEKMINITTNKVEDMKNTLLKKIKNDEEVFKEKLKKINDTFNEVISNHENNSLSTSVAIQGIKNEIKTLKHELVISNNENKSYIMDAINNNKKLEINNTNTNTFKYNKLDKIQNQIDTMHSSLNTFIGGFQSSLQCTKTLKPTDYKQLIITQKIMMKNINQIDKQFNELNICDIKQQLIKISQINNNNQIDLLLETFNRNSCDIGYINKSINTIKKYLCDSIVMNNALNDFEFDNVMKEKFDKYEKTIKEEYDKYKQIINNLQTDKRLLIKSFEAYKRNVKKMFYSGSKKL